MLYICFVKGFVIFLEMHPCIFVMCVVTSASLQSGALGNSVLRDLVISLSPGSVYLMMPYVHVVPSDPCLF